MTGEETLKSGKFLMCLKHWKLFDSIQWLSQKKFPFFFYINNLFFYKFNNLL